MAFPRQDISLLKKDLEWYRSHFRYAEELLKSANPRVAKFTRLYNEYNGVIPANSIQYLTKAYGKKNKTKYISYRIGRPKIDLINNEFLMRPLQATVYTVNASAKSEKLDQYETLLGAVSAKKEIEKLRSVGIDPLEGMEIPDAVDDSFWAKMSFKDKNEAVMQTIINHQIPALGLKEKLTKNFQDIEIVSMCYGKIVVDENGDEQYMRIDPRNAIYEEVENDTFLEKSPVMGHLERMPIHDVLVSFDLTEQERNELETIRSNASEYADNSSYRNLYTYVDGQLCVDVIFLEWKSVEPEYYKIVPKTKTQLEFDDSTTTYKMEMNTMSYLKNEEMHKKNIAAGKYDVEVGYKTVRLGGVQIGHNILKNLGEQKFTMRREDSPADVFSYSYCGAIFNTVNGERISLQEIIENFSSAFDVTMYQILKELNKAKGKVIGYNRGLLPKGKKITEVMYNALNDGFIDYDSTAQGNMSGRDLDITNMFKEIDLGVSSSFPALIALKQEIQQTIDRLTGINENREGQIAASSTATNAQSAIRASRTITEGMFFLMGLFTEKVLVKICETTKLTWGLYKTQKGQIVLGDEKFKFLEVTKDLAYQDYGVSLLDGGRELDLRQRFERYAEAALNAKDIRYKDIIQFDLQPTLVEATAVLEKAFTEMEKIRQSDMQSQGQVQTQIAQQQMATQIQIADADREDRQINEKENIILQGDTDIRVNSAKASGAMIAKQSEIEQQNLFSGQE